jgi:ACS family glucarate transporter-like MFS transporter
MGGVGLTLTFIWLKVIHNPADHPMINKSELEYIADGGGLTHMYDFKVTSKAAPGAQWDHIRQLVSNRMMIGIFLGQFCINAITYFFITWFPVYLVQARGMSILKVGFVAAVPAICGFSGGILGGVVSDWLIRRGWSLTKARKTPIVLGMALAMTMIGANYTDLQWVVVALMALAFFGKGFGALGWAVMSDTAPKEITGLAGAVFNMCGNLSSISTPLIIGAIVQATGSFDGALVFVGANAVVAAFSYLFVVGDIKRMVVR